MNYLSFSSLSLAAIVTTACLSFHATSQAAKVGINFQDDFGDGDGGAPVTDTSFDIPVTNWFNLPRVFNSIDAPFSTSTTITLPGAGPLLVEWSADNTYSLTGPTPATPGSPPGADQVVYGYLDDSGGGYRVKITGFRNSVSDYKVTLIASTDGGTGFANANVVQTSGTTSMIYGVPNPGDTVPALGEGIYAVTPESAVISAATQNNSISIQGTARSGSVRSTLAGIILDYTPSTTNVPVIEVPPTAPAGTIYAGGTLTLNVTATGSNLSYQWRRNGNPIAGNPSATTANFTKASLTSDDSGNYDVVVSGVGTPAVSSPLSITVSPLLQPVFTATPVSQSFYAGYPATFKAAATGGGLTYTWKKGATTVATGDTFSIPSIVPGDAGTYTVTASNAVGNVSASVTLTVKTPLPGTYEAVQAAQKPLLWYRYSETDGSRIQDTTANSGNLGANATGVGINATFPAPGALVASPDTAAMLDGSTARIMVGYLPALNPEQFTAEVWVKPALDGAAAVNKCVLSCGDFASPRAGWLIYQQPTGWNLRFYNQNGTNTSLNITGGSPPVAGTWYHLAVTWNGTTAILYVNGVATSEIPTGSPSAYVPGTNGAFAVGTRSDGGFFWGGTADEVAFYATPLASTAIIARYQNGISASPAVPYSTLVTNDNPALYLRLNDDSFKGSPVQNSGTLGAGWSGTHGGAGTVLGQPLIQLGEDGPRAPENPGFESSNTALGMSNGYNAVPPLNLTTNTVTVTTWIKRAARFTNDDLSWPAWLGAGGGFHLDGTNGRPYGELRYHWDASQWSWGSGLQVPEETWTFCALVIEPDKATIYMGDGDTLKKSSVNATHTPHLLNQALGFGGNQAERTSRNYVGQLDESAVYDRALSESELLSLFITGSGAPMILDIAAGGVIDDSKPLGLPLPGLNFGSSWLASSQDTNSVTRNGVQQFTADPGQQIQIPASTDLNSPTGTITFWMKSGLPTGSGSNGAMIYDYRTTSGLVVTLSNAGFLFLQTSGNANSFTDNVFVGDDLWHHVAVTYNQDPAGSIAVFIDGVAGVETPNTAAWAWPAATEPVIGKSRDPFWRKFGGQLDDFRLYSQILSGAEISQIKNTGNPVVPTTLRLRYDFGTPGSGLTLTWPFGTLESSSTLQSPGSWLPVPGATSPYPVIPTGNARFYRTRLP